MAPDRYGVNTLKSTSFRNATQHFGNTYYFEAPVPPTADVTLNDLIDDLVAWEKTIHGTTVNFVRARLWSQIGTPAQNNMLIDRSLSGTGSATAHGSLDKERAWLIRFRAGVDTRGRPVYLRKWFHLDALSIAGTSVGTDVMRNVSGFTAAHRTAMETLANNLKNFEYTPGQTWDLVAKNGRPIDGITQAHQFLEHHQLGDEWRGA